MLIPYEYGFDEKRQAIMFCTDNFIHYEVEIAEVGSYYFPNHPSLQSICYDLSLNALSENKIKNDERVCLTVVDIVKSLLLKGNIILFTCDSTDKRQKTRHRLFNQWFAKYGDQFEKHDIEVDDDIALYYLSLMINPKQHDSLFIQQIFQDSINEYIVCKNNT